MARDKNIVYQIAFKKNLNFKWVHVGPPREEAESQTVVHSYLPQKSEKLFLQPLSSETFALHFCAHFASFTESSRSIFDSSKLPTSFMLHLLLIPLDRKH